MAMMLTTTRSVLPQNNITSLGLDTRWRLQICGASPRRCSRCQFLRNQRMLTSSTEIRLHQASKRKMDMTARGGHESGSPLPLPGDPSPGSWKLWILGMIFTVVVPFWKNKWWPLLQLRDKVEAVVETAEHVTDIVEKVAEEVEHVAETVADNLPEGGKLKEAATFVENAAREMANGAHLVEEVIDKVEEVEKEAESLIDTVIDGAGEINKEIKKD